MTTVISIENLSKNYRLGAISTRTLWEDMSRWWARSRGLPDPTLKIGETDFGNREGEYIWALRDVSLEVKQGEVLGIIGRNGAGKSTLLKILSRVTAPTSGIVKVKGRIASLLEVGTGFHPDLTGRENIFLNGAILGMSKIEINRKLDEIIDFSGVEKFIDTPVKRYSSGMYVRLAFAVAAHLEPEILVVDEVLAVGDMEFQKKCLGKMDEVASQGRTILFVSHNMAMIQKLCPESILLDKGFFRLRGLSTKVVEKYLSDNAEQNGEYIWQWQKEKLNDVGVLIPLSFRIFNPEGDVTNRVFARNPLKIEFRYRLTQTVFNLRVGFTLQTSNGYEVFVSYDRDNPEEHDWYKRNPGMYVANCTLPKNLLNSKTYILGVITGIKGAKRLYRDLELIRFSVDATDSVGSHWGDGRGGVIKPDLRWETEFLGSNKDD